MSVHEDSQERTRERSEEWRTTFTHRLNDLLRGPLAAGGAE